LKWFTNGPNANSGYSCALFEAINGWFAVSL
jgi:hypothetical protein